LQVGSGTVPNPAATARDTRVVLDMTTAVRVEKLATNSPEPLFISEQAKEALWRPEQTPRQPSSPRIYRAATAS